MSSYPPRVRTASKTLATTYEQRPDELVLQFDTAAPTRVRDVLTRFGLQTVEHAELNAASALAATMRWVRVPVSQSAQNLPGLASRLLREENLPARITMVAPVYFAEDRGPISAIAPVPGKVLVKFRDNKEPAGFGSRNNLAVDRMASAHVHPFRVFLVEGSEASGPGATGPARRGTGSNVHPGEPTAAFEAQARLSALPEVDVVELDWLSFYALAMIPDDSFWANQWGMIRIGMPAAWDVQAGASALIIGVPDTGVDLTHPDLLLTDPKTHFNAVEAESGPGPYNAAPDLTFGAAPHGTLVSGIAAALPNNARGIAGVAGGCAVLPARVLPNPTSARFASAINWCVAHGARVINISWFTAPSNILKAAIDNAWAAGVVLCAGAGNQMGPNEDGTIPVVFPASYPPCIAVGAIDQVDRRKRQTSPDGEHWASAHGPELDVCAPGVKLWSTDIQATDGWNDNGGTAKLWMGVNYPSSGDASGDYFALMGGTSGATPHVSGLAALVMLKDSSLSNQQVRDLIESTCTKISPTRYAYAIVAGHPNGTWHPEVGYGLIDAHAALTHCNAPPGAPSNLRVG